MTRIHRHPVATLAAKIASSNDRGRCFFSSLAVREIISALLALSNIDERHFAQESLVALAAELGETRGQWQAAETLLTVVRSTVTRPLTAESLNGTS